MDFLILSGFNQNIIDFMNQDPSEILDGIDPIYPQGGEEQDETFFVRFANHRSMITYAPKSRSLEVGNDYIGTCPYSFLIHVMSLHNECLARDFEMRELAKLQSIDRELGSKAPSDGYASVARRINALKISRYRDFEQYRYINVFRYNTEREVFAELEQLRGVQRKATALDRLEDHTDDLESQRESERDRNLGAIGFLLGGIGVAEALSRLAEFINKHPGFAWLPASASGVLSWLSFGLTSAVLIAAGMLAFDRRDAIWQLFSTRRKS